MILKNVSILTAMLFLAACGGGSYESATGTSQSQSQGNCPGSDCVPDVPPPPAATPIPANAIFVSGAAELTTALQNATGGETIVLANGNYGSLTLEKNYTSYVTIQSANPLGAFFNGIGLHNVTYVIFDGVKTTGLYMDGYSTNSYWKFKNGASLNFYMGGNRDIYSVHHYEITGNTIGPSDGDYMRIAGNNHHGLVENNTFHDMVVMNPDAHPDFIQFTRSYDTGYERYTPHDITIRGNVMYDDPATGVIGTQGISVSDGGSDGYRGILIEQNMIRSVLTNAIVIHSGVENVVVRNNTLTNGRIWVCNNQGMGNAGTLVRDNVVPAILNDGGGSTVMRNYEGVPSPTLYASYVNGFTWQQYVPKAAGPIDFSTNYGAVARLQQLLSGAP